MKHDWEYKKLGDVCDIINGFAFKSNLFTANGFPILRISNIQNDSIDEENMVFFNPTDYSEDFNKYQVVKGDIVIAMSGATTGKIGIHTGITTYYLNQRVGKIKIKNYNLIIPSFLFYYLKTKSKSLLNDALGVAQPNISSAQIKGYTIPVPPIEEQKAICSLLDKLSRVIEAKKEQLKELDNLAQAIFYDMFGDPITNDKGWDVMTIGEVCKSKNSIIRANNYFDDSDTIDYIDISSIDNTLNIIISTSSFVFSEAPSRAQQKVEKDDLLISLVRPNLKNIALVSDSKTTTVASSGFCVLRASLVSPYYLKYLVITKEFTEYLCKRVCGISYPAVKEFDIKGCPIGVPPLLLQQAFAEKVEAIERQKELINQSIREVQTLFDSRMDYWFSD